VKKRYLVPLVLLSVSVATSLGLGISPHYVASTPSVAAGIGAKLLCSAKYVSGYSEAQALADVESYSPALQALSVEFDDARRSVSANFLGIKTISASYREGLGCALDFPELNVRDGVVVPALPQVDAPWPAGHQAPALSASLQRQLEGMLAADNAQGLNTRALLIVKNGELVAEAYGQGVDADSRVLGWSMAKSLTAMLLGQLEWQGRLAAQAPLFPQWAKDQDPRAQIQLEQLLTMTSGLGFSEVYEPGGDATAMLFVEPSAADYAAQSSLSQKPGSYFSYSSGTTNLLARLLQQQVGGGLQGSLDHLYSEFYQPLGMQRALFEVDSSGGLVGSSYFYASARDWARIGQLMLGQGEINGRRLLGQAWVSRAISPNGSANQQAYGYQFWLNSGVKPRWPNLPADAYAALGNRKQVMMMVPSEGLLILRLGWSTGGYPVNERFAELLAVTSSVKNTVQADLSTE